MDSPPQPALFILKVQLKAQGRPEFSSGQDTSETREVFCEEDERRDCVKRDQNRLETALADSG
jgi:hypothetical protein